MREKIGAKALYKNTVLKSTPPSYSRSRAERSTLPIPPRLRQHESYAWTTGTVGLADQHLPFSYGPWLPSAAEATLEELSRSGILHSASPKVTRSFDELRPYTASDCHHHRRPLVTGTSRTSEQHVKARCSPKVVSIHQVRKDAIFISHL